MSNCASALISLNGKRRNSNNIFLHLECPWGMQKKAAKMLNVTMINRPGGSLCMQQIVYTRLSASSKNSWEASQTEPPKNTKENKWHGRWKCTEIGYNSFLYLYSSFLKSNKKKCYSGGNWSIGSFYSYLIYVGKVCVFTIAAKKGFRRKWIHFFHDFLPVFICLSKHRKNPRAFSQ